MVIIIRKSMGLILFLTFMLAVTPIPELLQASEELKAEFYFRATLTSKERNKMGSFHSF